MKGVVDIEFIMAVFVFLGSISFVALLVGREFFVVREDSASESVKIRAATAAQMLMFDKGYPENWESISITDVRRLGLSSGNKFVLSKAKLDKLQSLCSSDYGIVRSLLDLHDDVNIGITALDGTPSWKCAPATESLNKQEFPAESYAVVDVNKEIVIFRITLVA